MSMLIALEEVICIQISAEICNNLNAEHGMKLCFRIKEHKLIGTYRKENDKYGQINDCILWILLWCVRMEG